MNQTANTEHMCKHGLMTDWAIRNHPGLKIDPFFDKRSGAGKISYGLSSMGYDLRLNNKYKIFTNAKCAVVDPKNISPDAFIDYEGDSCLIPPNSFALAESLEHITMPRDVTAIAVGKSTYARCGIIIPITPIECSFIGKITIEISNTTPLPAKVYSYEGICQLLFFHSPYEVEVSYSDKNGIYQNQPGLVLPRVRSF